MPVYAQNTEVRVNTMNVRIINKEDKKFTLTRNELPLDGKQRSKGVGEDHEIGATSSVLSSRCRSDPGVIISLFEVHL